VFAVCVLVGWFCVLGLCVLVRGGGVVLFQCFFCEVVWLVIFGWGYFGCSVWFYVCLVLGVRLVGGFVC